MNPFINTDWAKNFKYIRLATKVLKIIVIINILIGILSICLSFSSNVVVVNGNSIENTPGFLTTGTFIFNTFVGIFVMFTAARGLELFADVAEKILMSSEPSTIQPVQSG